MHVLLRSKPRCLLIHHERSKGSFSLVNDTTSQNLAKFDQLEIGVSSSRFVTLWPKIRGLGPGFALKHPAPYCVVSLIVGLLLACWWES